MRIRHDRRGQSVVIGTVILFGFLIVALSLYQAQVVPIQNSDVEFEHSQQTEKEFVDLRNNIINTGTTGASRSTAIELGTRYPQRIVAINPPPASGTVETSPERDVMIDATVDPDQASDPNVELFWETDPQFETRSIQYTPRYNELRDPPQLTYEHSFVAATFNTAVLLRSDQTLVRDTRVSIPTLRGTVSETSVQSATVDSEAISQQARTIPITGENGAPVEIRLPTAVADAEALASRLNVADAAAVNADGDTIVITLNGTTTYQLGMSAVSVDGGNNADPQYLVPTGDLAGERTVADGERVGIEVRDKYNNPVSETLVEIDGTVRSTNDDGRVFVDAEGSELVAQLPNAEEEYEELVFTVTSRPGDGTGTDPVLGPAITVDQADQDVAVDEGDEIELGDRGGGDVSIGGDLSSVGSDQLLRSGTPIQTIQYTVEDPDGEVFIEDATYATFNPDASSRAFAFDDIDANGLASEDLIDTAGWEEGENTLRLAAQDASGRFTPDDEQATVSVTVDDDTAGQGPFFPTSGSANRGQLRNFDNMQAADGNVAEFLGEGGGGEPFDVDIETEQVPAGEYRLEIQVAEGSSFQAGGIDVIVRDANGVIGSGTITETGLFTLDLDPSVEGDITVEYDGRNRNNDLFVDFQRLVSVDNN